MNQEDRNQIMEIISKNSYYYDFNQQEKRRELYTENANTGMWMSGEQIYNHHKYDEFIERQTARRNMLERRGIQPRHYNTDFVFESASDDLIKCRVMILTTWQEKESRGPRLIHSGYCDFEFVRSDSWWKISKRVLYIDHKIPPPNVTNV
jgi:hypothetical protein